MSIPNAMSSATSAAIVAAAAAAPRSVWSGTAAGVLGGFVEEREPRLDSRDLEDPLHAARAAHDAQPEALGGGTRVQLQHVAQARGVHELDLAQVQHQRAA